MNAWQMSRQMAYSLRQRKWEGNSGNEVVFHTSSAIETSAQIPLALNELILPAVFVHPIDAEADENDPRLLIERFEVTIVAEIAGGRHGRESLIGGSRAGGQGSSKGRGILEIEEEVLAVLQNVNQTGGVRLILRGKGASEPQFIEDRGDVSTRTLTFEAALTQARYYHPPLRLAGTGGSGQVSLTWLNPPTRYDTLAVILRRASGSTAPTSATAGTGVTLGSATATSVTDTGLGAGTYSYAVFMSYDETGAGSAERYSTQERTTTKTGVVVT